MKRNKERVELHCHTTMSTLDGVATPKSIINFVKEQGMSAVAITDHGNVLGYQEAPHYLSKEDDIKIIYGMEGYVVDDTESIFSGSLEDGQKTLSSDVVVVDIETTGFSPLQSDIIELAAVKIHDGKLAEEYNCLINPGKHIPGQIQVLTSIDDLMVKDARGIEEVLPEFLNFIGDSVLVAHNAPFDLGFIKENARRLGISFDNSRIDTVTFARSLLKDSLKFTLDAVAKALNVDIENRHRAVGDAKIAAEVYVKLIELARETGAVCLEELNKLTVSNEELCKKLPTFHTTILVKNDEGRKALFELVSMSNLKYFNRLPRIPLRELLSHRENLLIGSACESGMLGRAIRAGKDMSQIESIAAMFDFLEVQPVNENFWMIGNESEDTIKSVEDIKAYNQVILDLGEKLNIPVVATSDVHFLRPENAVSRRVMMCDRGFEDYSNQNNLYFRTTEEMLAEFDYLGEEKADEIVIENTNAIADQIEKIEPIPNCKFPICLPDADQKLRDLCGERLAKKYEENRREAASVRLQKELDYTIANGFSEIYLLWYEILQRNKLEKSQYSLRGSAAGSIICYLLDISHVDPLDEEVPLHSEFFQGYKGNKEPDIDMNIDEKIWRQVIDSVKDLPGLQTAIRASHHIPAGNLEVDEWIYWYEQCEEELSDSVKSIVKANCEEVLKRRGLLHPGGMMLVPEGIKITDYTPMDMDDDRKEETFHFTYHNLDHMFLKYDILAHTTCTMNRRLEELTGYYPSDDDIRDEEFASLFTSPRLLGIEDDNECGINTGMLGIPGFTSHFMLHLLGKLKPKTYAQLVKLECLSHGTDTWRENAEILLAEGKADISTIITTREDVFEGLLSHGMNREEAFIIAENVRKGKMSRGRMDEKYKADMEQHGVPKWFIWSCEQIKYLFPRAHGAEYIQMELRSLYYKLHYPEVYYPLFFEMFAPDSVNEYFKLEDGIKQLEVKILTEKESTMEELYYLKVWKEMILRK